MTLIGISILNYKKYTILSKIHIELNCLQMFSEKLWFDPYTNPMRDVLISIPFYRSGNWG